MLVLLCLTAPMIEIEFCNVGQELNIELNDNDRRSDKVVELPFN